MTDFDRGFRAGFKAGLSSATKDRSPAGEEEKPLTLADVRKMDSETVIERWDEVVPLLEANHA